ncbi:unnamed protein product [Lymnaea stagnalis]|uniref:Sodium-dependent phosphate transport protein 2B n=1 Tax=Lymnaea stagnalis TaxID=6523 RepID=A0AAV2GXT7_LYMST
MSSHGKYDELPTTDVLVNDIDEGIDIVSVTIEDITDKARGLTTGPPLLSNGLLTTDNLQGSKDSGFSSRVSEVDGAETEEDRSRRSLLKEHRKELASRLTRISECQNDEGCKCTPKAATINVIKVLGVILLLYVFICTLDLLSNAFRLLGGKTAGSVFQDSKLLANPITGLMIGVLATVILQSSSTSSSIVITMVASKIIDLHPAIPIIMGANIGTTVTNTLVSLAHSVNRKEFRRAFSGAVVHDVFNWLTSFLQCFHSVQFAGYLYHLTGAIVNSLDIDHMRAKNQDLLKTITKPLTSKIVQIDENVITSIAEGKMEFANKSVLKMNCKLPVVSEVVLMNETMFDNTTGESTWSLVNRTVERNPVENCGTLFNMIGWNDTSSGILLFFCSIIFLSLCLYLMVKLLHSLLGGQIAKAARKTINADFPRPFHWLTGYAAIIVGAGMTILVQSSSVFTSALTPLVGIGCLKIERMFPLTLGSNIGTTFTGILAALASSPDSLSTALQLAFCHLFFNITGILLFYPIPKMRQIVIGTAKYLGRTTAEYRWFAIAYLVFMFLIFPGFFFAVSFAGKVVFIIVSCLIAFIALFILVLNVMQKHEKLRRFLPVCMQTWNFLPEWMRSLAPVDRCMHKIFEKCCCQCCKKLKCMQNVDVDMGSIDSDSDIDSSVQSSYLPSAASSKIFLSSQSCTTLRLSESSRRIYKPASRRSSLRKSPLLLERKVAAIEESCVSRKSPSLGDRKPTAEEAQQNLLSNPEQGKAAFYISPSEIDLRRPELESEDSTIVDLKTKTVYLDKESVI